MKEISITRKIKVVRLFLTGLSYGDIARQVGIAKGSVAHIISEFREGDLPVPPDMVEYVDALRQLAVDFGKNNTSVIQVKSCLKLDAKLTEMGVSSEQAGQWLDICHDIASPAVSSDQFAAAALELARLVSESGLTYEDLIVEYNIKASRRKELDDEIAERVGTLNRVKQEEERAAGELDSITGAMAAAQETFQKQKDSLKSELDEYIARNRLSWKKVKLVEAAVNSGFTSTGLSEPEIEKVREQIIALGSLLEVVKKLEKKRDRLQSEVGQITKAKRFSSGNVKQLQNVSEELDISISDKYGEERQLDAKLESKKVELTEVEREIVGKIENLYILHQIIDFLFAPNCVSDQDLDRFVNLMITIRQNRLGIKPGRVVDSQGNVICECQVPKVYGNFAAHAVDIDHAREIFAHLLSPLVKDKFVSRSDYDLAKWNHEISERTAVIEATLKERSRHIV